MLRRRRCGLVLSCLVATLFSVGTSSQEAAPGRTIVLDIVVPTKPTERTMRVTTRENDAAVIEVADVGRFAFVPTVSNRSTTTVTVEILDDAQSPRKRLGDVIVELNGKPVQSKTSPSFRIGVSRIIDPSKQP